MVSLITTPLGSLHDYEVLAKAMALPGMQYNNQLHGGFNTPEGIEYLFTRISDQNLDSKKRQAFLEMLPPPWSMQDANGALPPHGLYFVRLAKLAKENVKDVDLATALIRLIGAGSAGGPLDRVGQQAQEEAVALLTALYKTPQEEDLRYAIERAARKTSWDAYAKLNSRCGPVISIATIPWDIGSYAKPPAHDIIAGLIYEFSFQKFDTYTVQIQPVLENVATGKSFPTDFDNKAGGFNPGSITSSTGSSGGFTALIAKPAEAPAGKYRLYFIIRQDGKVIGQSHFVEVTVE